MDFLWTYPNTRLRYFAETMQLAVESDASFLTQPGTKSCYAGHYYFESLPHLLSYNSAPFNAPIHTKCATIKNVVASVAESECSGVFNNTQKALVISRVAVALKHKQKPTTLKQIILRPTPTYMHPCGPNAARLRTCDFIGYNRTHLRFLKVVWDKGSNNYTDYYTKNHLPSHHRQTRPCYILKGHSVTALRM